jgi:pyruvate/2-oxoglutarate dehydrogenase complex dihydrolipoamide acyltransferase (E2) component
MSTELRIPKLAVSMQEGTIQAWLVDDGATVTEGQPIYTLEAEKTTTDIEAPASGVLRYTGATGTIYKVGTVIGRIE